MDNKVNEELSVKDTASAETLTPTEDTWAPWDRLPYYVIVQVYNYLKDSDRVAMAQVCQAWYNSFKDPSLWRSRKFYLDDYNGEKKIHFSSIFGNCLTKVEIACLGTTAQSEVYIQNTLENLMDKLETARLCSLKVLDIQPKVFHRPNKFKETLARSLIKLLNSQTALKHVALMYLQLYNKHGTEVLKVLQESSGQTLESLQLIGFLLSHQRLLRKDPLKYELLITDIEKFQNLKEISVNYGYLTEEIINRWTVEQKPKLERITLNVLDYEQPPEGYVHKITSKSWRNLAKAFPKIEVDLHIFDISNKTQIIELLTPGMPLSLLLVLSNLEKETDLEIPSVLMYIAETFDKKIVNYKIVLSDLKDSLLKEILGAFKKCGYMTGKRKPNKSVIWVATVILYNSGESHVRKLQISNGINEDSPYSHLSQDEIQTLNEILCNIPNFKVEIVNEN